MASKAVSKQEISAYEEALKRYGSRDNVTAVDIGFKYKDGKQQNSYAVRIHVREKIPASALEAAELFPESIGGIPVDIIEAVYEPHADSRGAATSEDLATRKKRLDPIMPGISIAHKSVSAGTLGAFVTDNLSGKPAILSNWHVLVGSSNASPGDPVTQPGSYDGGRAPRDTVASLERMILDKDGDAAIALLNGQRAKSPLIYETNAFLKAVSDPSIGDVLVKSGRTTGVTYGKVDGVGTYYITYSVGTKGIEGFKLVAQKPGNPDNEEISSGGDSGSIWYDPSSFSAIGLHFAGETSPTPSEEHAVACYATRVFKRLNISLPSSTSVELESRNNAIRQISSGLGAEIVETLEKEIGNVGLQRVADRLVRTHPAFASLGAPAEGELSRAEIEPFTAAVIGFAAGAAARIIGKSMESESVSQPEELISIGIAATAFLLGAAAGSRAVDGKL